MGRRHKTGRIPQNDRREAQREFRRAHQIPFPKAFGIRRPLELSAAQSIIEVVQRLQAEDDIPKDVKIRPSLHATLLPQRVFGQQVLKGLVSGYNINGLRAELRRKTDGAEDQHLTAQMKGVSVYKGRVINVLLDSEDMEGERSGIADTMERVGLRGLRRVREETVLHLSLGESRKGLTPTEQRHVEHIVTEHIDVSYGMENTLPFEHWEIYPDLDYWRQ